MAPRRIFGSTWWGKAWLESLETSRFAQEGRLGRGRTYARQDRVSGMSVEPGLVSARVEGTYVYSTSLSVRVLTAGQWEVLIDLIVSKARYSAELLSGAMPEGLAADAEEAGSPILPVAGDLGPDCSCPDWGDPCKHAAALCYLTCDLIDDDPFILLFVRGRDRASIVGEVRSRRAALSGTAGQAEQLSYVETLDPAEAFSRTVRPLPNGRPLPKEVGRPNPLRIPAPADSGLDTLDIERLGADAADRALGLLIGDGSSGLELTRNADFARRAFRRRSRGLGLEQLAATFPGTGEELEAAAIAWGIGGAAAVEVALGSWPATAEDLRIGRAALQGKPRKRANAVHSGTVQLRLDQQRRWWRFETDNRLGWILRAGPFNDPTQALAD